MKNIYLDETLTEYKQLLTKYGTINAAITKKPEFKNLKIYKRIFDETKELEALFPKITFAERLHYLLGNAKIENCPICKKEYIYFKCSEKRHALCKHKIKFFENQLENINKKVNLLKQNKEQFFESLNNKKLFLNEMEFHSLLKELNNKSENFGFTIKNKKYHKIYHDIIIKTENIIPINLNKLNISERIYLLVNNLQEIPLCQFCNKEKRQFKGRILGYNTSCGKCGLQKSILSKSISYKEKIDKLLNKEKYEIIEYPKQLNKDFLIIKCKKCQNISNVIINNGKIDTHLNDTFELCENCRKHSSINQFTIFNLIQKYYPSAILNSRKIISPLELDIYIPEKKLAIEYDGIYWHSQINDKKYHLNKTKLCEEKGIQLIHIFENEWLTKQEIVKSRILNLLGIYQKTIYARKCEIKEINSKTSVEFQNKNHIQSSTNTKINIGLYFENELVSLMTFGKNRFSKKYQYEMVRFCSKLNYHVVGAASKLLKYFEEKYQPKSIVSYADRRWSTGNLYKKLGFKLENISEPNYWYWKDLKFLENRIKFQKHKLKNILENFNENLSEYENMKNNGYKRIFDCGNLVFVKNY